VLLDDLLLVDIVILAKLAQKAEGGGKHVRVAVLTRVLLGLGEGGVVAD
jgi:hypothetical protein